MKCQNCGYELVEGDLMCPNCGELYYNAPTNSEPDRVEIPMEEREMDLAEQLNSIPVEEIPTEELPFPVKDNDDEESNTEVNSEETAMEETSSQRRPKGLAIGGLICAGIAVIVLVIMLAGSVGNWFVRTFFSPEDLMFRAYKNAGDALIEAVYVTAGSNREPSKNSGQSVEIHIKPQEKVLDLISNALFEESRDMQWMSDVGLNFSTLYANDLVRAKMALSLGRTEILSVDQICDDVNGKQWIQFPQLHEKALYTDTSETDEFRLIPETMDLYAFLPEKAILQDVFAEYLSATMTCFGNVEKYHETVMVGELTDKLLVLKVDATQEEITRWIIRMLEQAKNDERLLDLLVKLNETANDSILQGFTELSIDYRERILADIADSIEEWTDMLSVCEPQNVMTLYTYLNDKNQIVGIRIAATDLEDPLYYMVVAKGSKAEFTLELADLRLAGSITPGVRTEGSLELYVEDEKVSDIYLRDIRVTNKELLGTVIWDPSAKVIKEMAEAFVGDETQADQFAMNNVTVELSFAPEGKVSVLDFQVNGTSMLAVTVKQETMKNPTISIPENPVDMADGDAYAQWISEVDSDTIISNLEEANVPAEIRMIIAYIFRMM